LRSLRGAVAKKGHRRRHGMFPKTVGGAIGLAFKIMGGVVIGGPALGVLATDIPKGDYQSIPNDILFAYTGLGGSTQWNSAQALTGAGSIAGGLILIQLGKMLGKALR
jgi:hypothetical protein